MLLDTPFCVTRYKDRSCSPTHPFVLPDKKTPRVTRHTPLCYPIQRPLVLLDTPLCVTRYNDPLCCPTHPFVLPDAKTSPCYMIHTLPKLLNKTFLCYLTHFFVLLDTKTPRASQHTLWCFRAHTFLSLNVKATKSCKEGTLGQFYFCAMIHLQKNHIFNKLEERNWGNQKEQKTRE